MFCSDSAEELYIGNVKKKLSCFSYASVVYVSMFLTVRGNRKKCNPKLSVKWGNH